MSETTATPYHALPPSLRAQPGWCVWRLDERNGKKVKVPINPRTGRYARVNMPSTFSSFDDAVRVAPSYSGVGLRIDNDLAVIDVDNCVQDGALSDFAREVIGMLPHAYVETSPSGTGLRIVFLAKGFAFDKARWYVNNRKLGLEVYVAGATRKFATITGNALQYEELCDCTEALRALLERYMRRPDADGAPFDTSAACSCLTDEQALMRASAARNGQAFSALWAGDYQAYASQSEADLALCSMLAFWCGRDTEQMDRLFRQSGLYRDKWDRQQSGSTYGALTLRKAASACKEVYTPIPRLSIEEEFGDLDIPELSELMPHANARYSWSDVGNGYLFADYYRAIARYAPERKMWYVYNGCVWEADAGNLQVMELCKRLANNLIAYAIKIEDESVGEKYLKYIQCWKNRRMRETILKDAAGVYPIRMSEFDADVYTLNCLNGTLNLRDGTFHAHQAADLLTKCTGAAYARNVRSLRWEQYVDEVMSGDREKAAFFQKAMGYALTGDTRHECLFFLHGKTTRNGKSTAMETFLRMLGDYGRTARPESLAAKIHANGSAPSEDIARLAGARFVNVSEPDRKLVLSVSLVKALTGNDILNARYLNENSFEYRPTFKLFINCNHLPMINDVTLFNSGRVKIIPFDRHFSEEEQDKGLKETLTSADNLSGILNWCMEGLARLQSEGLDMPRAVLEATEAYRRDSDKLELFMEDTLIQDSDGEARMAAVYEAYSNWCVDNGYRSESKRTLSSMLQSVAIILRKRPKSGGEKTTMLLGYRIKPGVPLFTSPAA